MESSENIEKKIISAPTKTISTQPTSADGPVIWKGFINMIDVAKFRITAQEVRFVNILLCDQICLKEFCILFYHKKLLMSS